MNLYQISPDGIFETIVMGQDIFQNQKLQHIVPAGFWFGAIPWPETEYTLVGCTVSPGFDFSDFELGNRQFLMNLCPQSSEVIKKLTLPKV